MLALGVIEFGYVLLDEHIVTKLSREGSNLISRNTPLVQARVALATMSTRPVDFSTGSKLIFSVIRKGARRVRRIKSTILYRAMITRSRCRAANC